MHWNLAIDKSLTLYCSFLEIRWSVIRHAKTQGNDYVILVLHAALTKFKVLLDLCFSYQVL